MNVETLRLFASVARKGSFSSVARELNVAASSVSRTIVSLERELGIRLLHRSTRRCSLTEAGSSYLERVEPLIDLIEQANEEISRSDGGLRGKLRITAPIAFAQYNLLPLLAEFSALYPNLSFECLFADETLDFVKDRIDLAVRLGHLDDSILVAKRVGSMRWVACASPAYLKGAPKLKVPSDLSLHRCLTFPVAEYGTKWRFRLRGKPVRLVPLRFSCVLSHALAVRQSALLGMGILVLPEWTVRADLKERKLLEVLTDFEATASDFRAAVWLMLPSRNNLPAKTRAFADFLMKRLPERMA